MIDAERYKSDTPADTEAIGAALALRLSPGDVLLLTGQLGAGKTAFVRGLVSGLGSESHVSSPTFVLIHEYEASIPVAHIDLYRLPDQSDIAELGVGDYLEGGYVTVVEWPERAMGFQWGESVWSISIDIVSETSRLLQIAHVRGGKE